jgi:tetratricopeptide (TPR) repeat protein
MFTADLPICYWTRLADLQRIRRAMATSTALSHRAKGAAATADEAFRLGMAAFDQRRHADAERIARDVLTGQPQHGGALYLLGLALLRQNRPRDALLPLEQAARLSSDPVVETDYALALRDVGRTTEAIDWLDRATARQPPFANAFHELGMLLCSMHRYVEAETVLKRGVETAPDVPDLWTDLGGVYIGRADPANAKLAFSRALVCQPNEVRAQHGFGTALLFEGEFERAAERFRRALAHNPAHARSHLDLAHCMLELGRHQEALEQLRVLITMSPQFHGKALKILVSSGRGRFWLRPSEAMAMLEGRT